jgi:hypothetical protein
MKNLIKPIIIIVVVLLLGVIFLLNSDLNLKFGFHYRNNVDCNTSWIYYRLKENKEPIDYAFIGTSHSGCGINDSLIAKKIKSDKVANLAYCTPGRNMHFLVTEMLLKHKKPKAIFLEIGEYESGRSHRDFPLLATTQQLFSGFSIHNYSFFSDIIDGLKYRFYYQRNQLKGVNKFEPPLNYKEKFNYSPIYFIADSNRLNKNIKDNSAR